MKKSNSIEFIALIAKKTIKVMNSVGSVKRNGYLKAIATVGTLIV